MKIHLKKILVSFFVIAGFVFYAIYQRNSNGQPNFVIDPPTTNSPVTQSSSDLTSSTTESQSSSNSTSPSQSSTNQSTASAATTVANGQYKNGQYDGRIADAYYGNVQVRAIIQDGRLTDVEFLRYPNDRNQSIQITSYALPILKSEALKAQSAQVDIVSGATNISQAFINSLSSALRQARV